MTILNRYLFFAVSNIANRYFLFLSLTLCLFIVTHNSGLINKKNRPHASLFDVQRTSPFVGFQERNNIFLNFISGLSKDYKLFFFYPCGFSLNCQYIKTIPSFSYQAFLSNICLVIKQTLTSISITGTSIKTPTTVANEAPEDNPKSIVDVAIATSK